MKWLTLPLVLALTWPGRAQLLPSEEIARVACLRSRVVMMNEAHNGLLRLTRSRRLGQALLPVFQAGGVRVLAAEALDAATAAEANRTRRFPVFDSRVGYLGQPEMRQFLQAALDLNMNLASYEVDEKEYLAQRLWFDQHSITQGTERERFGGEDWNRFRELNQAQHLQKLLGGLRPEEKLLVWCGNGHLSKAPTQAGITGWSNRPYYLMGFHFQQLTGIEPFCIDQTSTADWPGEGTTRRGKLFLERFGSKLEGPEESAGVLMESLPQEEQKPGADALIFSRRNHFD